MISCELVRGANLVEVSLGRGGAICIYNGNGNTDVVVDVEGWLSLAGTDTTTAGLYRPVVPARLVDTRLHAGGSTTIGPGQSIDVQVAGNGNVPALAGRSPSQITRQLYDFKAGTRNGEGAAMMKPQVANMTDDMRIDIAAYLASLDP